MIPDLTLPALRAAYAAGTTPADVITSVYARIREVDDPAMFLALVPEEDALAAARALGAFDPMRPLWGVPFAVKDNIDVAGLPTTAACPAYGYMPERDAAVVERLRAAGALVLGKTNLDQFATGLVGVRSPHGVPRNAIDPEIVPGGSSSGSAVAVAQGIASFALGTDTAGSGRVPAALNNIVGLKPTLGTVSARGVVPACRSVETVSIFALTVDDAHEAFRAAAGFDPLDPYSRDIATPEIGAAPPALRIGIPSADSLRVFGDAAQTESFAAATASLHATGAEILAVDFQPFYDVAEMLYEGAWVAERHTVIEALMRDDPEAILPVTRAIISKAERLSATDAFRGMYRLKELARIAETALRGIDLLAVPTIPTFYTLNDLEADPVTPNSNLGTYTNFVNLLDMCALAVPVPPRHDGRPGNVTLLGRAGEDALLAAVARGLEQAGERSLGATGLARPAPVAPPAAAPEGHVEIAVCGAHMSGLPLNAQLTSRGGRFVRRAATSRDYALHLLPGGPPHRPGLVRRAEGQGHAVPLEIWSLPRVELGGFLEAIPAPLGLGRVRLEGGGEVIGFLCEAEATRGTEEIGAIGWRGWLAREAAPAV